MSEEYVGSIAELFKLFQVRVYCRIGAMYDSVPHTRPLVVTGNPCNLPQRPGVSSPVIQNRQSTYEGPTTILNTLTDAVAELGIESMSFMAHLPHYAQLDDDFNGTARMLAVLAAYYDIPSTLAPARRGKRQYAELDAAVEQQPEVKALVERLESYYDSRYPSEHAGVEEAPSLPPEIEQFLQGLDLGQEPGPPEKG
jgi:hypothetical protein